MVWTSVSRAAELCTPAYLRGCEVLGTDECLDKYLACGEYENLIRHFSGETLAADLKGKYFRGVSFYGLFARSGARSYQCAYARSARGHLLSFLSQTNSASALADETVLDRVRHATMLYSRLIEVEGCLEPGLTEMAVKQRTRQYLSPLLEGMFLPSRGADGVSDAIDKARQTIHNTISRFMEIAANIEAKIVLRGQALNASEFRINTIVEAYQGGASIPGADWTKNFGTAQTKRSDRGAIIEVTLADSLPEVGTFLEMAGADVGGWKDVIDAKDEEFKQALKEMSISEYEASRAEHVRRAKQLMAETAGVINMSTALLPNDIKPLQRLQSDLGALLEKNDMNKSYEEIRQAWKLQAVSRGYCKKESSAWYCNE